MTDPRERPDFAKVMAEHQYRGSYLEYCTCGQVNFADSDERRTHLGRIAEQHRTHLAAVLNAEVDRWLADEGTRERVAKTMFAHEQVARHESVEHRWETTLSDEDRNEYGSLATAALAALATPTVPTAEEES